MAFAGIGFTIYQQQGQLALQQSQLELQREELRLQREEMAASRGELAKQARAQYAPFTATTAQVVVAAMNAQVEANKLRAEGMNLSARQQEVESIESISHALSELANRLELAHPSAG